MAFRVAINGFGRIGRTTLRALFAAGHPALEVVAINDLTDSKQLAHLFKYDSVHGRYPGQVSVISEQEIEIDGQRIQTLAGRNPAELPWGKLGVDLVMECTGVFTSRESAAQHLSGGARKVLISAPAKGVDRMVVFGVNHQEIQPSDTIISNASCTTNCLAPLVHVLHQSVGVERGFMTTVHAYTGDQRTVDTTHRDPRRARAAAVNLIPTTTGSASAIGQVIPELAGKLDGTSIRVPVPLVSLVDLCVDTTRDTSAEEINSLMRAAAQGALQKVLVINDEPLVSSDFVQHPASSIFDATQTQVIEDRFARLVAWYDNEWGFSNRMVDIALALLNAG